jgi:transcriptional regulator with XRE-family HTH domain
MRAAIKTPQACLELDIGKLCAAIDEERDRRHLTHCEVAEQMGVSYSTYGYWRYRRTSMSAHVALRVSTWLGRDLRDFARYTEMDLDPPAQGQAA